MRSERTDPEHEIDRILKKLHADIPTRFKPMLDSLKHEITRISTGVYVLNTWAKDPATDLLWFGYGLTNFEVKTVVAMREAGPSGISKERLMAVLYAKEINDWPELKILDVRIHHIRDKLLAAQAPWWIETVHGTGWILHNEAKAPRKSACGDNLWSRKPTTSSRRPGARRKSNTI